jgi:DNA polymerase elongation subunit (family B)
MNKGPKVLLLDIETAPIMGYVWSLWDQNVGLNQIYKDWHVLSWAAKWLDSKEIMYMDQRKAKNVEDDAEILKKMWLLLNEADIVVTQNGKAFDIKKLNARFIMNGMKPTSSFRHLDTKEIASKYFGFTSNKLEYMTDKLCVKYKKLKPKKFQGFEMWKECLGGNLAAWKEMEKYNKHDVLSLEELFKKLIPWDNSINFSIYNDSEDNICICGNNRFIRNGFSYTSTGKYQRYSCSKCGAESKTGKNQISKSKRDSLLRPSRR